MMQVEFIFLSTPTFRTKCASLRSNYEVVGKSGGVLLVYLSTVVDGERAHELQRARRDHEMQARAGTTVRPRG